MSETPRTNIPQDCAVTPDDATCPGCGSKFDPHCLPSLTPRESFLCLCRRCNAVHIWPPATLEQTLEDLAWLIADKAYIAHHRH